MKLYTEMEIALMSLGERKILISESKRIIDSLGITKLREAELYKNEHSVFLENPKAVRTFLSLVYQNFVSFNQQINL